MINTETINIYEKKLCNLSEIEKYWIQEEWDNQKLKT